MAVPLPDCRFGDQPQPPAPDYGDLANWCAHPNKDHCPANDLVLGSMAPVPREERPCDCFYVCSTNWYGESWNAPVPDAVCDEWCDADTTKQSSAFNNRCRIFSPRYRQSLCVCFNKMVRPDQPEEMRHGGHASMDLAYSDVEKAFDEFVRQTGNDRPVIVASNSQGSQHATRLMERFHHDSALRRRLVCAYIFGHCGTFVADKFERCFPTLHACSGPLDTQCIVAFDHMSIGYETIQTLENNEGPSPKDAISVLSTGTDAPHNVRYPTGWEKAEARPMFCTNPITWTSNPGRADAKFHLGCAAFRLTTDAGTNGNYDDCIARKVTGVKVTGIEKVAVGASWAEIANDSGVLLQPLLREQLCHEEWGHWYFNIRENVAERVDGWLAKGAIIESNQIVLEVWGR